MTESAAVVREIRVTAGVERAFDVFTRQIGEWWPVDAHSVHEGTVAFEGDDLVERRGQHSAVWAEVTRSGPPFVLGLAWHAGHDASRSTDVMVTFTPNGDDTIVHLTHSGWERLGDGERAAADYAEGWPGVLARYASAVRG